jgi:hypothetical protein
MSGTRRTAAEPVYVLEISGVPTLAFAARNQAEAMTLRKEAWFLDDLKNTRSRGAPLWDGRPRSPCATHRRISRQDTSAQPKPSSMDRTIFSSAISSNWIVETSRHACSR